MSERAGLLKDAAAASIALCALIVPGLYDDPTPLLVEPWPDPDLPLGLAGAALGLWAAFRMTAMPAVRRKRVGRIAAWLTLPAFVSFSLILLADRAYEAFSFRSGGRERTVTVLALEKEESARRSGGRIYDLVVSNPFGPKRTKLRIDAPMFERIEPLRDCIAIQVERAPNDAVRLLRIVGQQTNCDGLVEPPAD
jgi:hypothetical protein